VEDRKNVANKRKEVKNVLYTEPNIITMTKPRKARQMKSGTRKGKVRNAHKIIV
jgi:hypothetical protein